jgi:opacity protein-like surface antigen
MLNLFSKGSLSTLLALVSLSVMNSSLTAWDSSCCDPCYSNPCDTSRMYIGAFGGGLYSDKTKISQLGTAYFPYDEEGAGGPLAVFAKGHTKRKSTGFGGVQVGYEWSKSMGCSGWSLAVAGEMEALFYGHKKKGHLFNNTAPDRLPEHDFLDSFDVTHSTILVNAVFALNSSCLWGITPYVGGGIGATHISIRKADSLQVEPVEAGVNHFNSRRNDSTWAFAAQAKAGLRYNITKSFHIFGEYRYLFVDASNFIFGSTVYPTHVPTSPWNVKIKDMNYNAFAFGIQYDL